MPSTMAYPQNEKLVQIVTKLYDVGGLKFGNYVMKSGRNSPVYVDLRVINSHPALLESVALLMWEFAESKLQYDSLCGVPYNALPIATVIAVKHGLPMLIRRKETKLYGTKKQIEGEINPGDHCVIIEDVVTTGSSISETVKDLRNVGLVVSDAIVIVDREQGGPKILADDGITLHSLCTMMQMMHILRDSGKVDQEMVDKVKTYLQDNQVSPSPPSIGSRLSMSFEARAGVAESAVARALLRLMVQKQSTLCVAADVATASELLTLARQVGPHICLLKTHADMVANFSASVADDLIQLATEMNFMILEDRKFADIGNTVAGQYRGGVFEISRWADLVTAHALPGEGLLKGLQVGASGINAPRGCFLLAEMSCAGNLITPEYVQGAVAMAKSFPETVAGLVGQSALVPNCPGLVQLTPGVRRGSVGDALGQQWVLPAEAVLQRGGDVIVVGRGVTAAPDPAAEASEYRQELWAAYLQRIGL